MKYTRGGGKDKPKFYLDHAQVILCHVPGTRAQKEIFTQLCGAGNKELIQLQGREWLGLPDPVDAWIIFSSCLQVPEMLSWTGLLHTLGSLHTSSSFSPTGLAVK